MKEHDVSFPADVVVIGGITAAALGLIALNPGEFFRKKANPHTQPLHAIEPRDWNPPVQVAEFVSPEPTVEERNTYRVYPEEAIPALRFNANCRCSEEPEGELCDYCYTQQILTR